MSKVLCLSLVALTLAARPAFADPAQVVSASAEQQNGIWRFDVTLRHQDTGWEDYADGWRIVDTDGNVLATRPLAHPHINEQPFTRSLSGVTLPDGIKEVWIEPSTKTQGWSGPAYKLSFD